MGCKVDHRRSFLTTPINPYYDSFVRWQFKKLNSLGLCRFGKRFVIWSPLDDQPCADHDRQSGEGVLPQEYTLIKLAVKRPYPSALESLKDKDVFFAAATLRPETMYGQTNCWILPDGDYGAYELKDGSVLILTERSAKNISYQEGTKEYGVPHCLLELKGSDLIGVPLCPPLATKYDVIYTLPMMTILMDKGTGVVTSVPSDAPADFRALQDLKEKPELRKKFSILDEWVLPYDPVEIVQVEGYGTLSAPKVCEEMKIKSQNDPELDEAKNICYKLGFNKGVMAVGKYAGEAVNVARPKIIEDMLASSQAIKYAEPADDVISRSGDSCVVALSDQWYLPYGEGEWMEKAKKALDSMRMYGDGKATRTAFKEAIEWLKDWAFSRTYGLGTHIPWDNQFLIESLSDSTIYMAYYTVAHILQGGSFDGSAPSLPVTPEQTSDQFWDYIFELSPNRPEGIPHEVVDRMRREFQYWYPYDCRVSGKDLVKNHLTFAVYHHVALFPEEKWPKGVRTNGFLLLNGKKMSKSSGNFLTLREAIEKYSADAMRMALAEAGDSLDNSNFTHGSANGAILRLHKLIEFYRDTVASSESHRKGDLTFRDQIFLSHLDNAIRKATAAFEEMNYRDALIAGAYDLRNELETYVKSTSALGGVHADVIGRYLEVQAILLEPICPHFAQYVWKEFLHRDTLVCDAQWPVESGKFDVSVMILKDEWLHDVISEIRAKIALEQKQAAKKLKGNLTCARVVVVRGEFPVWQMEAQKILEKCFDKQKCAFPPFPEIAAEIKNLECLKGDKKALPLCIKLVKDTITKVESEGAAALQLGLPFDEISVLLDNVDYLKATLCVGSLDVFAEGDGKGEENLPPRRILSCRGRPITASMFIQSDSQ